MSESRAERLRARWQQLRRGGDRSRGARGRAQESDAIPLPDSLLAQPLFGDLSPSEAAILGLFVRRETAGAGETVVRQGEQGDAFYLIEEGEAEVRARAGDGTTTTIASLGPGNYFGEIALVTGQPRTADVVATTPLTLLRLDRQAYELLSQVAATEELARVAQHRAEETRARVGTPAAE